MTDEELLKRVRTIIKNELDLTEDEVTPDSLLYDDLGSDSLGVVEILLALEEEFEVDLPDEELEGAEDGKDITVQQIVDIIKKAKEAQKEDG